MKKLLRPTVVALREPLDRLLARHTSSRDLWRRRRSSEADFWRDWVQTGGSWWPEERAERLAPDSRLAGRIARLVDRVPQTEVSILDVGAGPLTSLGKHHPTKRLSITPVDPLAPKYDRMLDEAGIVPPARTIDCAGEEVADRFGPDAFSIAYARNALDHSADPLRVIRAMIEVARDFVLLEHERNEAEHQRYHGLHIWNFDLEDERFVIWNLRERHDVAERVGLSPEVELTSDGWLAVIFPIGEASP
jgi:hypothetical protein